MPLGQICRDKSEARKQLEMPPGVKNPLKASATADRWKCAHLKASAMADRWKCGSFAKLYYGNVDWLMGGGGRGVGVMSVWLPRSYVELRSWESSWESSECRLVLTLAKQPFLWSHQTLSALTSGILGVWEQSWDYFQLLLSWPPGMDWALEPDFSEQATALSCISSSNQPRL